jgi:hypothetical protein
VSWCKSPSRQTERLVGHRHHQWTSQGLTINKWRF